MTTARDPGFLALLRERLAGEVRAEEPLARSSTYRIGGPATVVLPATIEDVAAAIRAAAEAGIRVFPLGLGSNVLLPDEGLEALVVRLGKGLDWMRADGATWRLGAGLPAPLAARRTAEAGWAGLHTMVGVPGTVGGGVYMNAGCHGGDWAGVVTTVTAVDGAGEVRQLSGAEAGFRYRGSALGSLVVVETAVRLTPADPAHLTQEIQRLLAWRQQGTPFNQPCCGSVFTNPAWPGEPPAPTLRTAGQLLEACGLKGMREGGAVVSEMHANYFVNTGGATASDVRRLMDRAQAAVRARFGIDLVPEVKLIAPSGARLTDHG